MYRLRFTVRGFGQFPLDMLRYDGCFPRNSADAASITDSLDPASRSVEREVELVRYFSGSRQTAPASALTPARWRSFGWTVTTPHPVEKV